MSNIKITKLPKSEVEIEGEIEAVRQEKVKVIKSLEYAYPC